MMKNWRGALFLFSVVILGLTVTHVVSADEGDSTGWNDYTNYTVIDHDTTWSGHITRADIPNPVVIVNDAVLTIAPGTQIEVGRLWVYSGRIVALGTETEPIHFTKREPDYSGVPADYAPYDKECYYQPEMGMIEFSSVAYDDSEPSILRFVQFEGMGAHEWYEAPHCPWSVSLANPVRNFFLERALAAGGWLSNPALKFSSGMVQIEHASFKNNHAADIETNLSFNDDQDWYDQLSITDSNFEGNTEGIAVISTIDYAGATDFSGRVFLRNNWYGDASGPETPSNPSGHGEKLIGTFNLDGWSVAKHSATCTENCFSNVMFLPGLESSRLYKDGVLGTENQLWEPNREADVEKLALDGDGKSRDGSIYTRDILDEKNVLPIGQGNIYKSFIKEMDKMKDTDHLINDWEAVPYDWRLSLDDILNGGKETGGDISYNESVPQPYIIQELERLASNSKSGKVTIIAHSNGGLLAKALIRKLGDTEAARLIDTVVLVAVPQLGTPQAIGALLHGYDQGLPFDWLSSILSIKGSRTLANNMPGAYHLLPSGAYFRGEGSGIETPPITFDGGVLTNQFIEKYGREIGDASELNAFLKNDEGKVSADSDDVVSPSMVNTKLLSYGKDTHDQLDDMTIPESIAVYQIAGFGEETLGTIRYWTGTSCVEETEIGECDEYAYAFLYTPDGMVDGDGTVVAPSALAMSAPNVKRYWVDLGDYNGPSTIDRKHADILEVPQLRDFIRDGIITKFSSALPSFISDSQPSTNSEKRLRYYLHSPLALSLRDSEGRETSLTASDIPGARYRHFGEVQYISVPASAHPTLMLDGESNGSFTLEVQEVDHNSVIGTTTFAGIPSTTATKVTMDFPDGTIAHATPLAIDFDGDGSVDHELAPVSGGTVLLDVSDTVPPTTHITVDGTEGANNWYTSGVTLTLTATDNENGSGVQETKYSLDNGATWNVSLAPVGISGEGTTTMLYFSTDKSGNREETKTQVIKIDRTAPEAKVSFDPNTQKLDITGRDSLSAVTVIVLEKPDLSPSSNKIQKIKHWFSQWHQRHRRNLPDMLATLTDEAGHVTSLSFEKSKDRNGFLFVRLQSIGYDGGETTFDTALLQYKWQMERRNVGQYHTLAAYLKGGTSGLESHYIPKKNETWIMERSGILRDDESDDDSNRRPTRKKLPGMVVPYMESEQGVVKIKY
jgi:hypothetical protein